jgi:hypothetical protein
MTNSPLDLPPGWDLIEDYDGAPYPHEFQVLAWERCAEYAREQRAAELREAAEFLRHPKYDGLDVYTIHQLCIELDSRADCIEGQCE